MIQKLSKLRITPSILRPVVSLNHDLFPIPPDTIEKLILDIDLSLHHAMGPPFPQKDLMLRNILWRSVDSSHQQTSGSALNHVHCRLA